MGRLWAMDQAISKCKEVGGVKCVALRKNILLLVVSDHACHDIFVMRHWILRHEKDSSDQNHLRTISLSGRDDWQVKVRRNASMTTK